MMPGGLKREKGVNVRLVVVAGGISGSVFWGEIKYSSADLYKRGFTEVVCDPAPVQHQKKIASSYFSSKCAIVRKWISRGLVEL